MTTVQPQMTDMRTEYGKTLIELGRENPNIVVLGADTTDSLKTIF
jgi:transketolase